MSYTRFALVLGFLALVGLCVLAGIGFTPAIPVLVTVALLVLFVGAGQPRVGTTGQAALSRPDEAIEPAPAADRPPEGAR